MVAAAGQHLCRSRHDNQRRFTVGHGNVDAIFIARTQQIGLGQAGLYSALVVGIGGSLGAAAGGAVADWLGREKPWAKLIVPVAGLLLSIACGLAGFLIAWDLAPAIAILALSAFFSQTYMGTGYATVLSLVPPQIRGTIASILLLSFGVLSYGTGTILVGYVGDHLAGSMGRHALGGGMAATLLFSFIGSMCFLRAALILRRQHAGAGDHHHGVISI